MPIEIPKGTKAGQSVLAALPLTLTSGNISGAGTAKKLNWIKDLAVVYAASEAAANAEDISIEGINGYTYVTPKITKKINIVDGTEKTSGSGSNADKFSFTVLSTTPTEIAWWAAQRGQPLIIAVSHGVTTDGTTAFYYLLGNVTSTVEHKPAGNAISELAIEFTGKSYATNGGTGDTAVLFAPGALTEAGRDSATDSITFTALVAGDRPTLLKGEIVQK
ncbi:MAG: hypothetical protein EKK55_24875 [Rhodocyclaceae bacterium]|nr:MAG: hypothetical protein EKK55_24875 [Rhodocyclaceae bacterium]